MLLCCCLFILCWPLLTGSTVLPTLSCKRNLWTTPNLKKIFWVKTNMHIRSGKLHLVCKMTWIIKTTKNFAHGQEIWWIVSYQMEKGLRYISKSRLLKNLLPTCNSQSMCEQKYVPSWKLLLNNWPGCPTKRVKLIILEAPHILPIV